ncbi:MAG: helix-turn-helix domain-containing protein [Sporichthyaceae bacterium]
MTPELVWRILARSGLTMTELAARASMSRASISEYAHGHRHPSLRQLERVAEAAGLVIEVDVAPDWRSRRKLEFEDVLELGDELPFAPGSEGPPTWAELIAR